MNNRSLSALKAVAALAISLGVVTSGQAQFTVDGTPTLWLRADQGVTAVSDRVSIWEDQGSAGADVVQSTEAAQPLFVPTGLNGHAALRFDGNDWLQNASVLGSSLFSATESTIFLVQNKNDDSIDTGSFAWSGGGEQLSVYATWGDRKLYFGHGPDLTGGVVGPADPPTGDWFGNPQLLTFTRDGNNAQFRNNGEAFFNTLFGGDADPSKSGRLTVGATTEALGFFTGDIAELIVFNAALSPEDIMEVENYLGDKYGLTVVPEPSSYAAIFALACLGAAFFVRRQRCCA